MKQENTGEAKECHMRAHELHSAPWIAFVFSTDAASCMAIDCFSVVDRFMNNANTQKHAFCCPRWRALITHLLCASFAEKCFVSRNFPSMSVLWITAKVKSHHLSWHVYGWIYKENNCWYQTSSFGRTTTGTMYKLDTYQQSVHRFVREINHWLSKG